METDEGKSFKARIFGVSCFLFVVSIIPTFWAWPAYTYAFGEPVEVTFTNCVTSGTRRNMATDCQATWEKDGVRHSGVITESLGEEIPDGDTVQARVWGDTARTSMEGRFEYYLGLAGPVFLVPSLLVILSLLPVLVIGAIRDAKEELRKEQEA